MSVGTKADQSARHQRQDGASSGQHDDPPAYDQLQVTPDLEAHGRQSAEHDPLIGYDPHHKSGERNRPSHKSTLKRLLVATGVAVLLLLCTGYWRNDLSNNLSWPPPKPPAHEGKPGNSAHWSSPKPATGRRGGSDSRWLSSTTNFTVSYDVDTQLFLHCLGNQYQGWLTVLADPRFEAGQIGVGVEVVWRAEDDRDELIWVGEMSQSSSRRGVGVYGHTGRSEDDVEYDHQSDVFVYVYLPRTHAADHVVSPLELVTETLSVFWNIGAADHVRLQDLYVKASAGEVSIEHIDVEESVKLEVSAGSIHRASEESSISAHRVDIVTDAGHVKFARVSATKGLDIHSRAGTTALDVVETAMANLTSGTGGIRAKDISVRENLAVHTQAGAIELAVRLSDRDGDSSHHTTSVEAVSDVGGIKLRYVEQAPNVVLRSTARSRAGAVHVSHHVNYGGEVDVETRMGRANVQWPTSKKYEVTQDRSGWVGRHIVGKVWGPGHDSGRVEGASIVYTEAGSAIVEL